MGAGNYSHNVGTKTHMALDAKQRRAIELLAAGHTQGEAAKELDVRRETINKWLNQNAEFAAEYDAVLKAQSAAFVRDMKGAAARVSLRWQSLIDSDDESIALRALLAWVEKFGGVSEAPAQADPADVNRVLAFMRWEAEQSNKAPAAARSEGNGDPTGTSD